MELCRLTTRCPGTTTTTATSNRSMSESGLQAQARLVNSDVEMMQQDTIYLQCCSEFSCCPSRHWSPCNHFERPFVPVHLLGRQSSSSLFRCVRLALPTGKRHARSCNRHGHWGWRPGSASPLTARRFKSHF